MSKPFTDYFASYKGDKRVLARELGFLLDGMNGLVLNRFDQAETTPGRISSLMNIFFKWSGLNFVTEQSRAGYAMWLSGFLGRNQGRTFADLDSNLKAMLEDHGFEAEHWEIFRKHMTEGVADGRYCNPDLARNLSDEAVDWLMPDRLTGDTPRHGDTQEQWDAARAKQRDRIRMDLETRARAFFIGETMFAVLEPDAKTTAAMTRGGRRRQHGEPEAAGDQAVRTVQGNLPFINLWYTKAALDDFGRNQGMDEPRLQAPDAAEHAGRTRAEAVDQVLGILSDL